jgi:cytoskeleton protein RodZ
MSETIGQQLKQAREARNLTFKKVTQSTHIQTRLIEAMEADDFESMPSPVQARAFLRLYAEFLGLSLDDLIARQRAGAYEPLAALHGAELAPSQSQEPGEVSDAPTIVGPVNEPQKDKSLFILHGKIKSLILRFQQILPQPKRSSVSVEPAVRITTSEPESIPDRRVRINGAKVEEPISDQGEEFLPPRKISLGSQSQVIFNSIGEALHERRETLGLTLDEIEDHTHVRKHYLQALEGGDFDHLPSSVQTRGMLNNYAHFLDMDVDVIVLQFAEGLQAQRLKHQPTPAGITRISDAKSPSRSILPPGLRRYLSMDVLVGVGLVLILLVFAIWGTTRVISLRSASTPQPTAQPISDILATAQAASTVTPVLENQSGARNVVPAVSSTAIVTLPAAGQGPVQIVLVALEQAFVRVTVDGKILFDGRVTSGTAYPFGGNTQIEVLTGNGAAISVLFNQSDLGLMGSIGEVVDRIYTTNAILNPTATTTPSPTITPTPTVTPRPSSTPLPGSTPQSPTTTQGHG